MYYLGGNFVCQTGNCNTLPNSATCVKRGQTLAQPIPPFTKFEFTIRAAGGGPDGIYDVALINGFNVPVEIKGLGASIPGNPFFCTGTGAVMQPPGSALGLCPWQFNPNFSGVDPLNVVWVTPGQPDTCTSNFSCTNGQVCGMAFDAAPPANPSSVNRRCGFFIGYTTLANFVGSPCQANGDLLVLICISNMIWERL